MATTKNLPRAKGERGPRESKLPTRERNRLIAQTKCKPLDVMLEVLAERYEASKTAKSASAKSKAQREAVAVAAQVAPYLHPKLQATTLKGDAANPVSFVLSLPDSATLKASIRGKG
jgi:hypothetical protein